MCSSDLPKTFLSFLSFIVVLSRLWGLEHCDPLGRAGGLRFPAARLRLWSPTTTAWTCPCARWAARSTRSSVPGGCQVCVQAGLCHPALRLKPTWGFCIHSTKMLLLCADAAPFQYVKIRTLIFCLLSYCYGTFGFLLLSVVSGFCCLISLLGYTFSCWLENYASFVLQENNQHLLNYLFSAVSLEFTVKSLNSYGFYF